MCLLFHPTVVFFTSHMRVGSRSCTAGVLVTCPASSVEHGIRQSANEKDLNDTAVKPPPLEHVTLSVWIYVAHWVGVFPLFCLESQL